MVIDPLVKLRAICLSLPEAHEVVAWGEPTFRVKNKLFAMYANPANHHGSGRHSVWCKAEHVTQQHLIRSRPERFFFPPYVGKSGWVGVWLDKRPSWKEVEALIHDSWSLVARKAPPRSGQRPRRK